MAKKPPSPKSSAKAPKGKMATNASDARKMAVAKKTRIKPGGNAGGKGGSMLGC